MNTALRLIRRTGLFVKKEALPEGRSTPIIPSNVNMYYGATQFAPYYYYLVKDGVAYGIMDGSSEGELIEVDLPSDLSARLIQMYTDEDRYIRPEYLVIDEAINYTDLKIRAISDKDKGQLKNLFKVLSGNATTLAPLVSALESIGEVVANNNDIQNVLYTYASRFYPEIAEGMEDNLDYGFDDNFTSFVPRSGFADIIGGIVDGIGAIIDSANASAINGEIVQWMGWYKSQVLGVDGRDIQREYDRMGPAAALVWLQRLKATSWKDIDDYVNRRFVQVLKVGAPEGYLAALAEWDKLETKLMQEAGQLPGPQPTAPPATTSPTPPPPVTGTTPTQTAPDQKEPMSTTTIILIVLAVVLVAPKLLK